MARKKDSDQLRNELKRLWAVYEGIYVLINATTVDIRAGFQQSRNNIEQMKPELLQNSAAQLEKEIDNLKSRYGVLASDEAIVGVARMVERVGKDTIALMPKYIIETFFSNYDQALRKFSRLPQHTRIAIDPGLYRVNQGTAELYLAEATLFEDLCFLNNLLLESSEEDSKLEKKKRSAFARTLIEASFRLLEAFLNGMAFDYNVTHHSQISPRDREILTEWDEQHSRIRYVSFKDKMTKYPKIVGNFPTPPLTVDNCPSMKYLIREAKVFRDAIAHASPFLEERDNLPEKDRAFYSVATEDAFSTVKAVLDVIEAIQAAIERPIENLWWFARPDSTGRFPDSVFD